MSLIRTFQLLQFREYPTCRDRTARTYKHAEARADGFGCGFWGPPLAPFAQIVVIVSQRAACQRILAHTWG